MIDMIDEPRLEELLGRAAEEIPVPVDGPGRVVDALALHGRADRGHGPRLMMPLLAAAAVVFGVLILVSALHGSSVRSASSKSSGVAAPDQFSNGGETHGYASGGAGFGPTSPVSGTGAKSKTSASSDTAGAGAPADAAKIVKTGTLDLQLAHGTLRVTVNRVTATAVGFGGYVSQSKTSYGAKSPTAQITIRVPVGQFESAITRLDALPGVKVLADSENGADVTGQYTDLEAQLRAATAARDSLLVVLSHAQSVGDILAVTDRVTAAQTQVDQLQGRINVLGDQAAFSSLAVSLSEKPIKASTTAKHSKPETGIAKSWADARHGFTNVVEWLLARSGGALIVLLLALALLYGVRYLYPLIRRGLV